MMLARVALVLAIVLAPLAASSSSSDPAHDERVSAGAVMTWIERPASELECTAPTVDVRQLGVTSTDTAVVLTLRVAHAFELPRCRGIPLSTSAWNVHMELEGHPFSVWALGGTYCNGGAWDCVDIVTPGGVDVTFDATGQLVGDTWTLTVPLSGRTLGGGSYDLRGAAYDAFGDAQQVVDTPPIQFVDDASLPGVLL